MPTGPIIVGYVDSDEGRAALAAAVAQAKLVGAAITVVASRRGGSGLTSDEAHGLEEELQDVRDALAGSGVTYDVRALVRGNDVAEDLVDLAEASDAQLIVIGLRKRTPVGKLIMGSNAQQILLSAPCPVLAVKA